VCKNRFGIPFISIFVDISQSIGEEEAPERTKGANPSAFFTACMQPLDISEVIVA
jgi:hypothetical protein